MRHLRSILLAAAVALPLSAVGLENSSLDQAATPEAAPGVDGHSASYDCCWIFMNGRWWCYSCSV